jgi:FkbM family methyltransferase
MAGFARRMLAWMALPYVRLELPGWGILARATLLDDATWADAPTRRIAGKLHRYEMNMDLRSWSDRQSFFLKRYYDLPGQLILKTALGEGDRFIDVGANIGMLTLMAARCVGPSGSIESFEPNPVAFGRLKEHVEMNQLANVKLHNAALADTPGTLELQVVGKHTGAGTLGQIRDSDKSSVSMSVPVSVLRGDDVIQPSKVPTTLKIDVEGFELNVLKGFETLLRENRPLVIAETVPWYLKRAGTDLNTLYDFMAERGYRPYGFPLVRNGLGHKLSFVPVEKSQAEEHKNIAWVHPESPHAQRLNLPV